jgi:hypothetical protein
VGRARAVFKRATVDHGDPISRAAAGLAVRHPEEPGKMALTESLTHSGAGPAAAEVAAVSIWLPVTGGMAVFQAVARAAVERGTTRQEGQAVQGATGSSGSGSFKPETGAISMPLEILDDDDLNNIDLALRTSDDVMEEYVKAAQAGLDVEAGRRRLEEVTVKLRNIKTVYFPGR